MARPTTPHDTQIAAPAAPALGTDTKILLPLDGSSPDGMLVPAAWTARVMDNNTLAYVDEIRPECVRPALLYRAATVGGQTLTLDPAQVDAGTWGDLAAWKRAQQNASSTAVPMQDAGPLSWADPATNDPANDGYGLSSTWQPLPGFMVMGELFLWHVLNRPAAPPAEQINSAAGTGAPVSCTVPGRPDLGTLTEVPDTWTVTNTVGGVATTWLRLGYMTPAEYAAAMPDPDPDPEPGGSITPAQVLTFAGLPATPALVDLVAGHLPIVSAQVYAYTRGRGFTTDPDTLVTTPAQPLAAVIVSATARSAANPTGAESIQLDQLRHRPGIYAGWTLPELAILHTYRKRWA